MAFLRHGHGKPYLAIDGKNSGFKEWPQMPNSRISTKLKTEKYICPVSRSVLLLARWEKRVICGYS